MPTFFTRPNPLKRPRRRRVRKFVPSTEPCRLEFILTERVPLVFELEVPDENDVLGRAPLEFILQHCRNEA